MTEPLVTSIVETPVIPASTLLVNLKTRLPGKSTCLKIAEIHAQADIQEILSKLSTPQLGKVWSWLNIFRWPECLPERDGCSLVSDFSKFGFVVRSLKSDDIESAREENEGDSRPDFQRTIQMMRAGLVMDYVISKIGYDECLRAWNTQPRGPGEKPSMTEAEFETWMQSRRNFQAQPHSMKVDRG